MLTREKLLKELDSLQGRIFYVEAMLPYVVKEGDTNLEFLACIRQRLYSTRCSLGSIHETVKDERNWHV